MNTGGAAAIVAIALSATAATAATAQGTQSYNLVEQDLATALRAFAATSGREVIAPSAIISGKRSTAVAGTLSAERAIAQLLDGTGLRADLVGGAFVIRIAARPAEPRDQSNAGADDIVVTGTRIRGAPPAGAHVITIDREDINRSGFATTQQILQSLPQNFGGGPNEGTVGFSVRNNTNSNFGLGSSANLRGLGTTSTLVLIDGNRPALGGGSGTFVDLTLIPSTAIDRVEVLADGASALYGSDAVAGVVNVRLRNTFEGAETRLRYGVADGFDEFQASQLAGLGWNTGRVVAGYEFYDRSRLAANDRSFATEDLRPFGGPDYRKTFASPGTIIAADGRQFAIPAGQDGTRLLPSDLRAGEANQSDGREQTDVLPALRRHAAYLAVEQDIGSWLKLAARGFFADRRTTARTFPDNFGGVIVPATNPFYIDPIGTGEPVSVNYSFVPDLGSATLNASVRSWAGVAGLEATLGRWSAAIHGSFGTQREFERTTNIPNYFYLARALADTDPATAYNVFGDGSFTNPVTIDSIRGWFEQTGRSRVWTTNLKVDGPLFRLPAGDVRVAFGGEYRRERYAFRAIDFSFTATPFDQGTAGYPISRGITAGYAELLIPIVAPEQNVTGIDRLDVSIAGRVERYSDFGSTTNPKIGVSWRPLDGLTVCGAFGTSFRAPSFNDTRTGRGTRQYIPFPLADPHSPTGSTNALLLFGANSDVGPEQARTWTAGADLAPVSLPGLRLSLTYFDIAYRDRIATLAADFASFLTNRALYQGIIDDDPHPAVIAGYYADENFLNPFGIAASEIAVITDGRTLNLATVHQRGLDFDLGYQLRREQTAFEIGVSGAYLFHVDQRTTPTAPVANIVSTIGNPVDLRLRARASATFGPLSLATFVNYIDGYRNTAVMPAEEVDSWSTVDLQIGYELGSDYGPLEGVKLALSVSNMFDRNPPYVNNPTVFSASGFDPENASPVGRMVALQLVKSW